MWYNVGSKDEPKGKTGFAHLFEHLMFNGSENLPGDFFTYLQQIGATDYNGTTWFDRTNYFETVPTGALDRALFMESDRMGYLLGAVTQDMLDNQRGVVQNEKRQGDNQPGGLVVYEVLGSLFPDGHPYRHSTIGSMADLDAASLADVEATGSATNMAPTMRCWCSPATSTPPTARPLVEKYFGAIPRGPVNNAAAGRGADARRAQVDRDEGPCRGDQRVSATGRCRACSIRSWSRSTSAARCSAGSPARASTRCWCATRRSRSSVSAGLYAFQRVGIFTVQATVKPGVDPALVEKRLDELVGRIHRQGTDRRRGAPRRVSEVAGRSGGSSRSAASAARRSTLAEGQTYAGDSDWYARTSPPMPRSPRPRSARRCSSG